MGAVLSQGLQGDGPGKYFCLSFINIIFRGKLGRQDHLLSEAPGPRGHPSLVSSLQWRQKYFGSCYGEAILRAVFIMYRSLPGHLAAVLRVNHGELAVLDHGALRGKKEYNIERRIALAVSHAAYTLYQAPPALQRRYVRTK